MDNIKIQNKKLSGTFSGFFKKYKDVSALSGMRSSANRNTVTGLRLGADFIEWTTARDAKTGVEILASNSSVLPFDPAKHKENEARDEQIKFHCSGIENAVSVGIAPDKMLMRVAELPTTDPVEMANMIQLQVDTFSPFPDDRIYVSYEVLASGETGVRVLIAAVQKDLVETTGEVLKKAGLDVQRIDAEAMAWWHLISENVLPPDDNRYLFLVLEQWGGVWIAVQRRTPLAFRAVSSPEGVPFPDFASEVARDAGAFLLSIDMENGSVPLAGLEIFSRGIDAGVLSAALRDEIQHEAALHSLDSLPPVSEGLARRFARTGLLPSLSRARSGRAVLDLVPASWRSAVLARQLRRRLIAASIGILAFWLMAMAVFFGVYQYQHFRLAKLDKKMVALQKPAEEVRVMQNQCRSFEQYLDRKYSALECLREVSQNLPKDVLLTSFQFKKGKSIIIRGEALAVNAIYDYKQALDKSPLFAKIDMGSVQPGKRKDTSVNTFQMTARFKEQK
jgi:hypothetical protein